MSDFNLRLLGKDLAVQTFDGILPESRKNINLVSIFNKNDPTTRSLKSLDLFEYLQAHQMKVEDFNSLPIFEIHNKLDGESNARPVAVTFSGNISAIYLEFNLVHKTDTDTAYCNVTLRGTEGTYELYGNANPSIYYTDQDKQLIIYDGIESDIYVTKIKIYGENASAVECVTVSQPAGNELICTLKNGLITEGSFDPMGSIDFESLDSRMPSLMVRDQRSNVYYVPARSVIYGAINKTRYCTIDVSTQSQYPDISSWTIDNSDVKVINWTGDIVIVLKGSRENNLIIANSSLIKSPRKLTIINESNVSISYGWNATNINSQRVTIGIGYELYHYQATQSTRPILANKCKIEYASGTALITTDLDGTITGRNYAVTLPKLPYIMVGSNVIKVPANGLSFGEMYRNDIPNKTFYGIMLDNGSYYFSSMCYATGGLAPSAESDSDVRDWTSLYQNKLPLELSSINWGSSMRNYGCFNFWLIEDVYGYTPLISLS